MLDEQCAQHPTPARGQVMLLSLARGRADAFKEATLGLRGVASLHAYHLCSWITSTHARVPLAASLALAGRASAHVGAWSC